MARRQFRVLYREFAFRIVDVETLSPRGTGDASRLLAQFAALLISISCVLSLPALFSRRSPDVSTDAAVLAGHMVGQHFLIATTMLVVALFGVLSWENAFPHRRDVSVLSPLPVQPWTILRARIAAVMTLLGLTILCLHSATGLIWPLAFGSRPRDVRLPSFALEPATPPLGIPAIKGAIDRAMNDPIAQGSLPAGTGVVVGIVKGADRLVLTYGGVRPDSVFEIGSITKTFTGLILARMTVDGRARLDEPVRALLKPRVELPGPGVEEITLLDLATHRSGLPLMPDNAAPAEPGNPYAEYDAGRLFDLVRRRGLARPEDTLYGYSNVGVALLGEALATRAGTAYEKLLLDEVTGPLDMRDTVVTMPAERRSRLLEGHDGSGRPTHEWTLGALAAAGGIRSTAADMLTFVDAHLHPASHPALARALALTQAVYAATPSGTRSGLTWTYDPDTGTYRHGGATGGFTSHVFFAPSCQCGAIVLMNRGLNAVLTADLIAEHVRQRLAGEPATTLRSVTIAASNGTAALLRSYAAYWITMAAAGVFVYACILLVQGLLLWLPRGWFLRSSTCVQIAAFGAAVSFYFLQPAFGGLGDLGARSRLAVAQWVPSYWFLGLYHQLNGSLHPALAPQAQRAWLGLALVVAGSAAACATAYSRVLRAIAEQPDVPLALPGSRLWRLLGNGFRGAIARFAARSLLRSRDHRLRLAFYVGVAGALASVLLKDPFTAQALADQGGGNPWRTASVALWASSIIAMTLMVIGTRAAFVVPLELPAAWVFQATGSRSGSDLLSAARRPLFLLGVVPVWLVSTALCAWLWPSWPSLAHAALLGCYGSALAEVVLLRFPKIPFASSYVPGRSQVHIVLMGGFLLLLASIQVALYERAAFKSLRTSIAWLAIAATSWAVARACTGRAAKHRGEPALDDEAVATRAGLGLAND